jgi:hypothetical protein
MDNGFRDRTESLDLREVWFQFASEFASARVATPPPHMRQLRRRECMSSKHRRRAERRSRRRALDGEEVLAALRAREPTREIPVVILSADAKRDRAQLLAAGAQAYLTKPIGVRSLLEVLDHFLGEPARNPVRGSATNVAR